MAIVSRETTEILAEYARLFRKWSAKINLASASDLTDLEARHLQDCLQISSLSDNPRQWTDIGSGGGLPGIVIAISLVNQPTKVTLIESDQRKSAFLKTVRRELSLDHLHIINQRIETAPQQSADVVSARALAPLPKLLGYVNRHLNPDGKALLMKGINWRAEVEEARQIWHFNYQAHPSATNPDAAILEITDIKNVQS